MMNACRKGMHDFQEFASRSKSCNFVLYALTKTTENPLTKYAQEHKMHRECTTPEFSLEVMLSQYFIANIYLSTRERADH